MALSGLIFVALALVWAVALLPKALRHHDEVAQTRSVDTVSHGARVLARREAVSDREARLVVTPPAAAMVPSQRTEGLPAVPVPAPRKPVSIGQARVKARAEARRKAAARAARRRRHLLGLLLVASIGIGVATALGHLQLWSPAVPVAVTVGFLVLARVMVRREQARWDAELDKLRRTGWSALETTAPPAIPADRTEDEPADAPLSETRNEQGLVVVTGLDDTSSFPVGVLRGAETTADAGSLWDPLPMTLPTYVSAPRATRSVRTIDLSAPGVSSSGHDAASSALVAEAATSNGSDGLPQRAVGS